MRGDAQRFSIFHDGGREPSLKSWHAPYARAFGGHRVADVGCGPGYFLDLIRDQGIVGFGIDLDPDMVEAAKRRGHEAIVGDHRTLAGMPNTFSGVHLSHIIEHLWGDDAVALLEGAISSLIEGGLLVVRTPNWANAAVMGGGFWMDHTHKRPYPREVIEKLVTDLGGDVVQSGHEPYGWEDVFVIARKRAATPEPAAQPTGITLDFSGSPLAAPRAAPAAAGSVALLDKPQPPDVRAVMMWRGEYMAQHSFARVNRELSRAMIAAGNIDIVPQGEPSNVVELAVGAPVRRIEAVATAGVPVFTLKHQWPPHFLTPSQGFSIHIQPYEFGSVPRQLAERVNGLVDDLWCPSQYVKQLYVDAGLPPERAFVLPWGVDPSIFNRDVAPYDIGSTSTFMFLFVGGTIWRKGIDTLLDAYLAEFSPSDDVVLVVKSFGSGTFYRGQNSTERITELSKRTDVPMVRITEDTVNDKTMAALYRRADAFFAPYRGEGFGMPVLEAMACGTPVFVTRGGATDDYVTDDVGYRMPADRIDIGEHVAGEELAGTGWILEVSQATLQQYLRHAFEHRDEIRAVGARAAERVATSYTWRDSATKAIARLDELSRRTPIVRAPVDDLNAYEATVHSQNGEDGILIELFSRLRVDRAFFAEFGAEAGVQCNSAALARMYGWAGLFIEGDPTIYGHLKRNYADNTRVKTACAMVDRENIGAIFAANGVPLDLDFLSIDIDGNDYYMWEALAAYRARVVVIEINPSHPPPERWVMAYNPTHVWQHDDYYGASLSSLTALGERLGYALLGVERNMVNAFFIRRDLLHAVGFPERAPEDVYRRPGWLQPHRDGPALAL